MLSDGGVAFPVSLTYSLKRMNSFHLQFLWLCFKASRTVESKSAAVAEKGRKRKR